MRTVLVGVLCLLCVRFAAAAPDCDGAWVKRVRVKPKQGRIDLLLNVVRPGVTHDAFVGADGLTLVVRDLRSGAVLVDLALPQGAFEVGRKRTRARGGDLEGSLTLARAAGQDDAVALRLRLAGVALPAGAAPLDLRAELGGGGACARTCIASCTPANNGRLHCDGSAAYRPFEDEGFGAFSGPAGKQPKVVSRFCGLSVDPTADCDPLIEEKCILPYPSSKFLAPDPETPTGLRVSYGPESLPASVGGKHVEPADWRTLDGFSPAPPIMALFPDTGAPVDLDASGAAPQTDFARSLDPDAPIVLMNAATGERIAHFAELDANTDDVGDRALIIRPARRLEDATRYVVAIRNLVDTAGTPIRPRLVFRALRDAASRDEVAAACGSPCGALVDERGAEFAQLFDTLETNGVDPSELVLAWDFTTAGTETLTSWMVSIRDQAFALPTPAFTVDSVDTGGGTGFSDTAYARIEGTFQAPLFMTADAPASRLVLGPDGLPMQNGWAQVPWVVDVPYSVWDGGLTATPGRASLWGHGLLGDRYQVDSLGKASQEYGIVLAAVDMQGMAIEDVGPAVVPAILDLSKFHFIPERLHQGILHHLLLGRLLQDPVGGFTSDPAFHADGDAGNPASSFVDPTRVYYSGGSQGGIFGLTIMAVAENYERGFLAVPGANYSTLLQRAAPFKLFQDLLRPVYPDRLDELLLIALMQQLWDRADPIAYLPHIVPGDLSTPPVPHKVLLHMSTCDSQVSNLGTEIAVRSMGIPQMAPPLHDFFDIPQDAGPVDGSALQEIDWGRCGPRCNVPGDDDPGAPCMVDADCPGPGDKPARTRCDDGTPPLANLIPPFDNGAHGAEGGAPATDPGPRQVEGFLRPDGVITQYCSGPCDPD